LTRSPQRKGGIAASLRIDRFLEHRVGDKRIIRLIQKWLKAGILEEGIVTVDDRGTGQGSFKAQLRVTRG
jgi:hypothetical protein